MTTQAEKAEAFRQLHRQANPLILANAWDVPSARLFENAGFPAVATSSAGMMVSRGYRDGEEMPKRELLEAIGRIAGRLQVPLSADIVSGYGKGSGSVVRMVRQVVEAGAVGLNIEDLDTPTGALRPLRGQLAKIRAIRALAGELGIPIVINARTDALRHGPGEPADRFKEAIRRCIAFRDAGADCVYPMGLVDAAEIERFVPAVGCPVNVMVRRGLPPLAELTRLGAKRISFGPAASYAIFGFLNRVSREILVEGRFDGLVNEAISFDELNALAIAKTT